MSTLLKEFINGLTSWVFHIARLFLVFAAHVMKRCSVQFLREIPIPSINCCSHYSKEPVVCVGQSTTGVSEFLSSEQLPIKTCFLTACNVMSCNHPNLKKTFTTTTTTTTSAGPGITEWSNSEIAFLRLQMHSLVPNLFNINSIYPLIT